MRNRTLIRCAKAAAGPIPIGLGLAFGLFVCVAGCPCTITSPPASRPREVLLLGNTQMRFNDLPGLLSGLAEAQGKDLHVESHTPLGTTLDFHTLSPTTNRLIESRAWDDVILQDAGCVVAAADESRSAVLATLRTLAAAIRANCSTTRILFCLPWAGESGTPWPRCGTGDYFATQERILEHTLGYADSLDIAIAPVGWAWNAVMRDAPPRHYLFLSDGNHPSLRGSYLTACVLFAAMYGESAAGSPFLGGLTPTEASRFQRTAAAVVLDDPEQWHLEGDR